MAGDALFPSNMRPRVIEFSPINETTPLLRCGARLAADTRGAEWESDGRLLYLLSWG